MGQYRGHIVSTVVSRSRGIRHTFEIKGCLIRMYTNSLYKLVPPSVKHSNLGLEGVCLGCPCFLNVCKQV